MENNEDSLFAMIYLDKVKEWTKKNRLLLFLTLTAIVLTIVLLYKGSTKTRDNALLAERTYERYLKQKDESSMRKLIALSLKDKHVALSYEIPIALYFLENDQKEEAKPFIDRSLKELQKISPFHETYSNGTASILKADYTKALQSALLLRGQFAETPEAKEKYSSLYYSNLLRIALLYKKLHNPNSELAAWEELGSLPGHTPWMETLQQNGVAMEDFMKDRMLELKNSR